MGEGCTCTAHDTIVVETRTRGPNQQRIDQARFEGQKKRWKERGEGEERAAPIRLNWPRDRNVAAGGLLITTVRVTWMTRGGANPGEGRIPEFAIHQHHGPRGVVPR